MVGREANDGQIRLRIGAENLAAVFSFVGEADGDLVGALDDVEIGEHEPAFVDDHARPETGPAELGARAGALGAEELIEEVFEERILTAARGRARPAARLGALDGAEMDDGGANLLCDADEALLERLGDRGTGRGLGGRDVDGRRTREASMREIAAGGRHQDDDGDEDHAQDRPTHGVHSTRASG